MGYALKAPGGGGKVTTENAYAGNIKNGVTVSVKQGSKVVEQVTGTYKGESVTTSNLYTGNIKKGVTVGVSRGYDTIAEVVGTYEGEPVSATNLTANNIKKGVTVTVKQGSKVVQSVNGNLQLKRAVLSGASPIDVKPYIGTWQTLTTSNFFFSGGKVVEWIGNNGYDAVIPARQSLEHYGTIALDYDSQNGMLTYSIESTYSGGGWRNFSERMELRDAQFTAIYL